MSSTKVFNPDTSPLEGLMLLEASAGTGKTYALERMVARLVARDENPLKIEEILVVTFTKRAAREMKERIRSLLALRAREASRDSAEKKRCLAAVSGFDRSAIYTIHGFCQMVLSFWPFESSSPFKQELVPGGVLESTELRSWIAGLQKNDLKKDAFRAAYKKARSIENLIDEISISMVSDSIPPGAVLLPTEKEFAAFDTYAENSKLPESPLSLAADALFSVTWSDEAINGVIKNANGPRSGKRVTSLKKIRNHMKACGELVSRGGAGIIQLSQAIFREPVSAEFGKHFLELMAAGISLRGENTVGETAALTAALSGLFHAMEPYIEIFGKSVNSLVTSCLCCAFKNTAEQSVKERLRILKNQTGRWGYADLIRRVADKISEPDSALLKVLRKRFKAGLVDEFQDTDPRQWNLFKTIFGSPDTPHLLALIGDPKQSIYGFRGTGLQAYNQARSSVSAEKRFRLDTNYRSAPFLVEASNRFFSSLFSDSSVEFEPVKSGKVDSDTLLWADGEIPVSLVKVDDRNHAARVTAQEIRRILDPKTGAEWLRKDGKKERVSPADIAVLVRGYAEEDRIIHCLGEMEVPVVSIKSSSIFNQHITEVLKGLLEAFEKPRDMRMWRSVLLDDFFGLPSDLLMTFQEEGRLDEFVEKGDQWQKLFLLGRATEAFDDFFDFSSRVGAWVIDAGRTVLGEYLKHPWTQRIVTGPDGLRQWQNWRHLCEVIQNHQNQGVMDVSRIKSWIIEQAKAPNIEGSAESLRLETEDPAVKVLTMHSAKGLEFPLVFLLGDFNKKSPRGRDESYRFEKNGKFVVDRVCRESNRNAHLANRMEEDKRLWYVAFTRAAVKLWMPLLPSKGGTSLESLLEEVFRCRSDKEEPVAPSPRLFATMEISEASIPPLPVRSYPKPRMAELPAGSTSCRDPVTSSYTSLVKFVPSQEEDDKDMDAEIPGLGGEKQSDIETISKSENHRDLPMSADRGALFGTLVHALFERCNFNSVKENTLEKWFVDKETEELFRSLSRRYFPPDWYVKRAEDLKRLVWNTLHAPISGMGRLCDIEKKGMRPEIEFHMAVPRKAEFSCGEIQIMISRGFLKGFIDLCLVSNNQWWVVDWKTNVPPGVESAESYDSETLQKMMDHGYYHLQYELYLLALCRTLSGSRGEAVNWEVEIGGAAYLFVRGTREEDSRGVFIAKPSLDRMLALASDMGLGEVVK